MQKYILVFLIFGSALAFNPFLNTDVFEFPKLVVLFLCVGALTVFNIFEVAQRGFPAAHFRHHRAEIFFLSIFVLANILAYAFSTDRQASLIGENYRFQGLLTQLHYMLLLLNGWYVFARQEGAWDATMLWLRRSLLAALFAVCALALLPYLFPMTFPFYFFTPAFFSHRVFGTFGNPNYLAVFIVGTAPFLYGYKKIFQGFFVALAGVTLFLTGSRSAWAALFLTFLLVGFFRILKKRDYRVMAVTLLVGFLMVLGGVVKSSLPSAPQLERLAFDTPQSTSLQTRLHLWAAGWRMFLARPLTGVGQDNIREHIEPYLPEYLKSNDIFFIDRTHSEIVDMFVMLGVLGGIGYLGFFITIVAKAVNHEEERSLLPLLAAFVALFLFQAVNFSTVSSNVLWYVFAAMLISVRR